MIIVSGEGADIQRHDNGPSAGEDNSYLAYFNYAITPAVNSNYSHAGVTVYTELWGDKYARSIDCIKGNLVINNTNTSNVGAAIMGHVGTGLGTGANANSLFGFRSSLDHRSGGVVGKMTGFCCPQVDVEAGGTIDEVRGFHVRPLAGPGKTKTWAFQSEGTKDDVTFAGPTRVGSLTLTRLALPPTEPGTLDYDDDHLYLMTSVGLKRIPLEAIPA